LAAPILIEKCSKTGLYAPRIVKYMSPCLNSLLRSAQFLRWWVIIGGESCFFSVWRVETSHGATVKLTRGPAADQVPHGGLELALRSPSPSDTSLLSHYQFRTKPFRLYMPDLDRPSNVIL